MKSLLNNHDNNEPKRLLRIRDILGDPWATPPIKPLIPVCKTSWWNGVKSGRFPKPVKLGPRITAWKSEDIAALCNRDGGENP